MLWLRNIHIPLEKNMKLKALKLKNFRSYGEEAIVPISDFTAVIGKNDIGKSTILEALEIFFNQDVVKMDQNDQCVHTDDAPVEITCVFDELPHELTIDARSQTNMVDEFLVNEDGHFEVVKQFNCALKTPKETVWAKARHPSAAGVADLLSLKNPQLKARAAELEVPLDGVDQRSNVELRNAIRATVGELELETRLVSLVEEDGKKAWEFVQRSLPVFALFQADRPSKDDDPEVSDPMKTAVQAAVREVEADLEAIKQRVQQSAMEVAQRTLAKLAEMDAGLAAQLTPTFKAEPKWDGFKLTLSGDHDIPINKRGSGVRRLILLNFFRAEAERRREVANSQRVIFAIEEPESSQHPDNQRMLVKSLLALGDDPNTQVIVTTHVPSVAAQIPSDSVRLVTTGENSFPIVEVGDDGVYERAVETLGILPDKRAQVAIFVEGPNDVEFLLRISRLHRAVDDTLIDLDNDHRVAFVVTGGGNLKHWVNRRYLQNAGMIEVHIYDADDQVNPPYGAQVDTINAAADQNIGFLTSKREMENYIHEDAIQAEYGIAIVGTDWADIPNLIAEQVHVGSNSPVAWADVAAEKVAEKESRAKKRLNTTALNTMTLDQLNQKDTTGDVLSWLEAIRDRTSPL